MNLAAILQGIAALLAPLARLAGTAMAWLAGWRRARIAALTRSNEVKDAQLDAANDRPRGRGDLARRLRDAGF